VLARHRDIPPIIWQNLREMAKPKPVPPNFRLVEASACTKAWKSLPELLRRHANSRIRDLKL